MNRKKELDLELSEEVAQGHYANLAVITHSTSEFVIDFASLMPGVAKGRVHSRIVLTPEHAKRLLMSLQDNITCYESALGRIIIPTPIAHDCLEEPDHQIAFGFNVGEA